ncbi:MAG: hypothetical protein SFV19_20800 [Rhodospirillaceae bacterium]|nr:hypothetical protein [Rhodospirillaceae bacterium]
MAAMPPEAWCFCITALNSISSCQSITPDMTLAGGGDVSCGEIPFVLREKKSGGKISADI